MLERMSGLPDGVLGFTGHGELHASDYTDVLLPALREVIDHDGELRVLLEFPTWDGMSGGALAQDLKLGVEHLSRWKKIALVTDVEWMVHLSHLFGWMTPGALRTFPASERDDAISWLAAEREPPE